VGAEAISLYTGCGGALVQPRRLRFVPGAVEAFAYSCAVNDAPDAAPSRELWVAAVIPTLLGALFTWWAWKDGAYFGTVFYPGAVAVFALLGLLLFVAPIRVRISGPTLVGVVALIGIGVWTLIAFLWSPDRTVAIADSYKAFLYAAMFGVGILTCALLGRRVEWVLAPVAVAGVLVGAGTILTLATGHNLSAYLHPDATLRFPIGYRNADSAFFMICIWALLSLAVGGRARWPLRAAMLAGTTMMLELVVLAQSRGSLPAAAVALVFYLILTPNRLRHVAYLALAVIPVVVALPALLDVFQHGGIAGVLPLLRSAAKAVALTTLLSFLLAALSLALVEPRMRLGPTWTKRISRSLAAVAVVAVTLGAGVFLAEQGGPAHFLDQRISEFNRAVSPGFNRAETRFGVNVSSEREDLWRVASDEFVHHPLLGGGPGSFQFSYLRHRRTEVTPKDPHSVELLMLSELGLPGFILFIVFIGGTAVAVMRSRRVSRSAAVLSAGAMVSGAYWLVHSSYDWFWHYPVVTAPAIFLLGAAATPALRSSARALGRVKLIPIVLLAALALGTIPFYLAERYTDRALGEWQANPTVAYDDLDRAASLNPLSLEPLLIKGAIAAKEGDRALALSAFEKAKSRVPQSYAPYYFIARELLRSDPIGARRALGTARTLNPKDLQSIALARRLSRR
jgi:hypothetical protein